LKPDKERKEMIQKLALSGRMFAGKDHVAKLGGFEILGFADPIYAVCKFFYGTADKTLPGVRKFQQQIGQWGRGIINDQYPLTAERAMFTDTVRRNGAQIFGSDYYRLDINFKSYGKNENFWIDILLQRVAAQLKASPAAKIAVTNARFDNELAALKNAGFEHYHVMTHPETRIARLGEAYSPEADNDYSEQMAARLDKDQPGMLTIWNDNRNPTRPALYVGQFLQLVNLSAC
jgi:hypothetical protein